MYSSLIILTYFIYTYFIIIFWLHHSTLPFCFFTLFFLLCLSLLLQLVIMLSWPVFLIHCTVDPVLAFVWRKKTETEVNTNAQGAKKKISTLFFIDWYCKNKSKQTNFSWIVLLWWSTRANDFPGNICDTADVLISLWIIQTSRCLSWEHTWVVHVWHQTGGHIPQKQEVKIRQLHTCKQQTIKGIKKGYMSHWYVLTHATPRWHLSY